jgi:hypothetical protein
MKARESHRRTGRSFCRYWGASDSSCSMSFEQARCRKGSAAPRPSGIPVIAPGHLDPRAARILGRIRPIFDSCAARGSVQYSMHNTTACNVLAGYIMDHVFGVRDFARGGGYASASEINAGLAKHAAEGSWPKQDVGLLIGMTSSAPDPDCVIGPSR